MTLYEQIESSCKMVQEEILQYSTVWSDKRVIIRPFKWANRIEVYIKGFSILEYSFTEDYQKIAKDIYNLIYKNQAVTNVEKG